ncbi:hypothetical protein PAXRUDRAFT_161556, partial [Paxillus rubicundulus Ve08.2h10]
HDSSVSWSPVDTIVLVDEVIAHWAQVGDGMNFKSSIWTSISACLGLSQPLKGGLKAGKLCKEKWKRVCCINMMIIHEADAWPSKRSHLEHE